MKIKKYHTLGTVTKSNQKIVERGKIDRRKTFERIDRTKERNKTDIRATTFNPFERKFNNPFEREYKLFL